MWQEQILHAHPHVRTSHINFTFNWVWFSLHCHGIYTFGHSFFAQRLFVLPSIDLFTRVGYGIQCEWWNTLTELRYVCLLFTAIDCKQTPTSHLFTLPLVTYVLPHAYEQSPTVASALAPSLPASRWGAKALINEHFELIFMGKFLRNHWPIHFNHKSGARKNFLHRFALY